MAMLTGAAAKRRKRSVGQGEGEHHHVVVVDRISRLPDGVLGDIISFLPTRDGARTQVLSSRWRPLWRSAAAALNVDLQDRAVWGRHVAAVGEVVTRILSVHPGPGRRFSVPEHYLDYNNGSPAATLDGWLRSPALDGLQELDFGYGRPPHDDVDCYRSYHDPPPPLLPSVHRFSRPPFASPPSVAVPSRPMEETTTTTPPRWLSTCHISGGSVSFKPCR